MPPNAAHFLDDGESLAHLNRQEIRNMDRDVRLLLTKARSAESLTRNAQATQLVLQYVALPKWQQKVVRDFFIAQLRALDVQDADKHLPLPTDEEIAAEQQAAAAAGAQKPASASVSAKLGDFVGSERQQIVERDYGITAASPEEIQQAAQVAAQIQQVPTPAHHLHALPPANAA